MKIGLILITLLYAVSLKAETPSSDAATGVFPYPVEKVTLENGLDILFVEMPEFKDVLSFSTMVLAGARNETQPGKTGFAHLFEHIMFQHSYEGILNGYRRAMNRLGTHNNGWTNYDITFYPPLTFSSNMDDRTLPGGETMPGLFTLEASRFSELIFDEDIFKRETGAVLGEYRKNATNPGGAMYDSILTLMFPRHSYGHSTIGYREDVFDMPQHYEHARWFYDTYYRPNNIVLIVAGDIRKDDVLPKLEAAYGAWKPKKIPPITLKDPRQKGEKRGHISWEAAVPPRIAVAYKGQRYVTGSKETAIMQILPELLTSRSAPLYQKMRSEKQSASSLFLWTPDSFDPYLIWLGATLFADKYADQGSPYLEDAEGDMVLGFEELKEFASQSKNTEALETIKSKFKYDFLAQLNSPANVARNLALHYRFERDPDAIDKLVASVDALTAEDIETFAKQYFVADNRTVVVLTPKGDE